MKYTAIVKRLVVQNQIYAGLNFDVQQQKVKNVKKTEDQDEVEARQLKKEIMDAHRKNIEEKQYRNSLVENNFMLEEELKSLRTRSRRWKKGREDESEEESECEEDEQADLESLIKVLKKETERNEDSEEAANESDDEYSHHSD